MNPARADLVPGERLGDELSERLLDRARLFMREPVPVREPQLASDLDLRSHRTLHRSQQLWIGRSASIAHRTHAAVPPASHPL